LRPTYILLCLLGTVLPYSQFLPWLAEHGLVVDVMVREIAASRLSAFAWLDVLLSAAALLVFMRHESRGQRLRTVVLPLIGLLTVGVSLALPLYLLLRKPAGQVRAQAA
jgi:hypothetical protein